MRTLVAVLVSLLAVGCTTDSSADGESSSMDSTGGDESGVSGSQQLAERMEDPEAARVFASVLDTLAPDGGWERTRYVQFDWMVSRGDGEPLRRSHQWDRYDGRYRVEAPVSGSEMTALFNVNSPTEGEQIWMDGDPVSDAARSDSLANRAYSMFINDSYWLLFPFKWADPGVQASYLGEMDVWGDTYEVVELTFEDVGLTPQNRYRGFVDPESGVMELWQHWTNASDTEPRFTNRWADWQSYGPILLSSRRESEDGTVGIFFENLAASTEVPEGAFQAP